MLVNDIAINKLLKNVYTDKNYFLIPNNSQIINKKFTF